MSSHENSSGKGRVLGPEEIASRYFKRYSWDECDQDAEKFKSTHLNKELGELIRIYGEFSFQAGVDDRVKHIEGNLKGYYGKFKLMIKFAYTIGITAMAVLMLLEIKRYYNIDVFPGYDSNVDDVYGAIRGALSELFTGSKE